MDVKEAIEKRRAYRSFDTVVITKELVDDLASCARIAPSCFNKQPWRYVFVFGKEALPKFKEVLSPGNDWARDSSMIIAVVSKKDLDCVMKDGREYYSYDVGMATAFMILRATELGLIAHPIAGYDQKKAKEILKIPDDMTVITLVNVGKHASDIKPSLNNEQAEVEKARPERLPLDQIAFYDYYGKR
ncbi:MAG: nitroreductase family protein [Elusimicrobia bacterium]|nr:nitroreductase family protein [Elusimicrobiota bacterium]